MHQSEKDPIFHVSLLLSLFISQSLSIPADRHHPNCNVQLWILQNYIGSYESCTTNELELSAHKNHIKLF